jgi:hypothetical protein
MDCFVAALPRNDAASKISNTEYTVIASEAKQSSLSRRLMDCFVAAFLAMTIHGWL